MSLDPLPDERILWQGSPAHRTVFQRRDLAWIRFSLKFDAVLLVILVAVVALLTVWMDVGDVWVVLAATFVAPAVLRYVEPFVWRYRTLHRTTYYVTDQRVVAVPRRRARSARLAEIDNLAFAEEADGSGYIRIDQRIMPDGYGNGTVAELFHVPDVRKVATLLSTLTGRTPVNVD